MLEQKEKTQEMRESLNRLHEDMLVIRNQEGHQIIAFEQIEFERRVQEDKARLDRRLPELPTQTSACFPHVHTLANVAPPANSVSLSYFIQHHASILVDNFSLASKVASVRNIVKWQFNVHDRSRTSSLLKAASQLLLLTTFAINHIFTHLEGEDPAHVRAQRALSAYLACRPALVESIALLLQESGNYYDDSDVVRAEAVKLYESVDNLLTNMPRTRMITTLGEPITGTNPSPRERWIPYVGTNAFHDDSYLPIAFNLPQEAFTVSKPGFRQNQKLVAINNFFFRRFAKSDMLKAPFFGGSSDSSPTLLSTIFSTRTAFNHMLTPEGVVRTILQWLVRSFELIAEDTNDETLDDDITVYEALELYMEISKCTKEIIAYVLQTAIGDRDHTATDAIWDAYEDLYKVLNTINTRLFSSRQHSICRGAQCAPHVNPGSQLPIVSAISDPTEWMREIRDRHEWCDPRTISPLTTEPKSLNTDHLPNGNIGETEGSNNNSDSGDNEGDGDAFALNGMPPTPPPEADMIMVESTDSMPPY